jgi:signal transduction histidine kinase
MKIDSKRSLILLLVVPVLLVVQLGLGISIFRTTRKAATIERNNNKLDLYVRTNSKYVSYSESAVREYQLTGDIKYYESYKISLDEWKKNEAYFDTLAPEIKTRKDLQPLRDLALQKLNQIVQIMDLYRSSAKDSALSLGKSPSAQALMDSVRSNSTDLRNMLTAETAYARAQVFKLIYAFIIVIATLIVLSLFFAWFIYTTFNQHTSQLEKSVASLEEANHKMLKLNEDFKAANNYLEQLAFISAHDLKSPIHTLGGLVDLMMRAENQSPANQEIMRMQKKVIFQMQQTNNGLNDILKLREGLLSEASINREPMALSAIVDTVKSNLQQSLDESGTRLTVNLNGLDKVPFPFLYIQSMLYNLISNALKFRHSGRIPVINLQVKWAEKDIFIFVISDNGLGFDISRSKGKLFGIFKRFHPEIQGTGVGLHIVKSIVEAFNGEIEVESAVDKGTEFTITIKNPLIN